MEYLNYSIIIIGSGLAGLYSALKLSEIIPNDGKILLVTKSSLGESNSKYAQGGIVAVLNENSEDSVDSHISDTMNAGAGLCDFSAVKFISENSDKAIKDLINFGVEFDTDENNNLLFTLEGAHSAKRILHCNGDATGYGIEEALSKRVRENQKIDLMEYSVAVELLLSKDDSCKGAIIFNGKNYFVAISNYTIIATGGIGQLYKNTTNPKGATGDGIALAYNAGAILQDLEFVQFHPTALAVQSQDANFLISEAVRGEGAILVDDNGNPFMQKYHELKDLAPRDIVTRANFEQMEKSGNDYVYLNATKIPADTALKRFPNISNVCMKNGIDITKDYIPVHPAAHYFMGGIKANIDGRTSINGLFALGEVASTGLHGANRLASNSLLECVVMGYLLTEYFSKLSFDNNTLADKSDFEPVLRKYSQELGFIEYDTDLLKSELQELMWKNVGILRNEDSLKNANMELYKLKQMFLRHEKCLNIQEYEFKNMLITAQLIINSALNRKESRGAHYRTDFMVTKDIAEHTCIIKQEGELNFVR
ncbi:L-aspartate oxidase [bacterium]|nr:L-aspartate oxidase [bacterium]